ncbi:amino-acid permease inda1 [Atractiella rhizophila]|nr:amino-acid permease inda1 [Atractiella rhizophila]
MSDEKAYSPSKEDHTVVTTKAASYDGLWDPSHESKWTRLGLTVESFKRAPNAVIHKIDVEAAEASGKPVDQMAAKEGSAMQHQFKNRHLQMLAVAGSIGTGLFIGSGGALTRGGPAGVLIAWLIMGIMLLMVMQAAGELAIMYPVTGGFYTLSDRFIQPSWAMAMGWNYVLQWAVVLPLELIAAAVTVSFWRDDISQAVWITVFFITVIIVNIFPIGFAEEEFWTSWIKLLTVIGFLIFALIMVLGGGKSGSDYDSYVGGRYWNSPGAFANGFPGVCSVFVTAAFSFAGTEIIALAASETAQPKKHMPSAINLTFWRVTLIYVMSLLFCGLLIPYDDPDLFGTSSWDANFSPFVIVIRRANVAGLPSVVNVVICLSVLSIAMSCVFAGSRTLQGLGHQGYAPSIFTYVDKAGRPLVAVTTIIVFGPLAYVSLAKKGLTAFDWLLALSGLSTLFTWGSICVAHIRFRAAWKAQGKDLGEIPFKAAFGVPGSYLGLFLVVLVLILQLYVAVDPIDGSAPTAEGFFLSYLAFPIVLAFWAIAFFFKRDGFRKASEIDLDTGRKCWDSAEQLAAEREARIGTGPLKYIRRLF